MRCYYQLVNYNPSLKINDYSRLYRCTLDIPFNTTPEELENNLLMKNKSNVLQYKKNQNTLSKSQIYSRKIFRNWINNKKTYASQTDKNTNPNTGSLFRVSGNVISVDGDPISNNIYCIYNPETFPSNQPSEIVEIPDYDYVTPPVNIIEPPESTGSITANFVPPDVPQEEDENYVAPSGGVLLCNVTVIPTCSVNTEGQIIIKETENIVCYGTEFSDVPGRGVLCWKEGDQTWYDRTTNIIT
jgi:hypothetical protein